MIARLSIAEIAERMRPHAAAVAHSLLGPDNPAFRRKHEIRWGSGGKLALSLSGERAGRWADFSESGKAAGGDVLVLIARERNCSLPEAAAWAADWLGLASPGGGARQQTLTETIAAAPMPPDPVEDGDAEQRRARNIEIARTIWREAVPIVGTPAERYLSGRGISADLIADVSGHALRFHPACYRQNSEGKAEYLPAMIGLIRNVRTDEGQGVHRTYLRSDGSGKVETGADRLALGQAHEGAVMLSRADSVYKGLHVAEGIETSLSVAALGFLPCWSLLNAGNLAAFPVLSGIECLTVFADNDPAKGPRQKRAGQEAATIVCERWQKAGREVIAYLPPQEGQDFNDLIGRAA